MDDCPWNAGLSSQVLNWDCWKHIENNSFLWSNLFAVGWGKSVAEGRIYLVRYPTLTAHHGKASCHFRDKGTKWIKSFLVFFVVVLGNTTTPISFMVLGRSILCSGSRNGEFVGLSAALCSTKTWLLSALDFLNWKGKGIPELTLKPRSVVYKNLL